MKTLHKFLSEVTDHIQLYGFNDVLELIPYFEKLELIEWRALVNKKNKKPVNTTIYQSDIIRLVIIYWDGNQKSSIHGHKEGGGLIKVLDGQLEETRFDPIDKDVTGRFVYTKGVDTYINDEIALHQIQNPFQIPAVSLHLYTKTA